MESTAVVVTTIAATGLFLSVVAWKLLDIAKQAMSRETERRRDDRAHPSQRNRTT